MEEDRTKQILKLSLKNNLNRLYLIEQLIKSAVKSKFLLNKAEKLMSKVQE